MILAENRATTVSIKKTWRTSLRIDLPGETLSIQFLRVNTNLIHNHQSYPLRSRLKQRYAEKLNSFFPCNGYAYYFAFQTRWLKQRNLNNLLPTYVRAHMSMWPVATYVQVVVFLYYTKGIACFNHLHKNKRKPYWQTIFIYKLK